jgi:hypothetical protein
MLGWERLAKINPSLKRLQAHCPRVLVAKQGLDLHQVPSHIFEAVLEAASPAIVAAIIRSLALMLYAGHFHLRHCHFNCHRHRFWNRGPNEVKTHHVLFCAFTFVAIQKNMFK